MATFGVEQQGKSTGGSEQEERHKVSGDHHWLRFQQIHNGQSFVCGVAKGCHEGKGSFFMNNHSLLFLLPVLFVGAIWL
jgi:hypothetical protein